MKKSVLIISIVLITFVLLFCGKKDDPIYFQKLLNEMIETANEKDIDGFMDFFSINYKDEYGANYLVIKNLVKTHFERFDKFEVVYEDLSVYISKDENGKKTAEVSFEIIVTGVKDGVLVNEIIGESGHLEYIVLTFKKSDLRKWKIVKIDGLDDKNY